MSLEGPPDLRELLRRAICDFIEPMAISHMTKDTEWRVEADKFLKECVPLVFGKDESVFGVKPEGKTILNLSNGKANV